jgi:hypothetical protein
MQNSFIADTSSAISRYSNQLDLPKGSWYGTLLVGGIPTPLKNDGVRQLG